MSDVEGGWGVVTVGVPRVVGAGPRSMAEIVDTKSHTRNNCPELL